MVLDADRAGGVHVILDVSNDHAVDLDADLVAVAADAILVPALETTGPHAFHVAIDLGLVAISFVDQHVW